MAPLRPATTPPPPPPAAAAGPVVRNPLERFKEANRIYPAEMSGTR